MAAEEITVRILQLGQRVVDVQVAPGQTLGATLAAHDMQIGLGFDMRINGAPADTGTPLQDGDVVTLIPRIKGGSHGRQFPLSR